MDKITLSVRDFALPAKRRGSIDSVSVYNLLSQQDGNEIHRVIQDRLLRQEAGYSKEISLSHTFTHDNIEIHVRGRMDGLFNAGDIPVIEEIKSTNSTERLSAALADDKEHPYILQTKMYAYLYHLQTKLKPTCRLRLVSNSTMTEELIDVPFDPAEFSSWVATRLKRLIKDEIKRLKHIAARVAAAEKMTFPFANPRTGQADLVAIVEEGCKNKKHLMLQAPTGLGKTIGVMYPSLKEALSRGKHLVYVTPKNSQHAVAQDAVKRIQESAPKVRSVVINAKKKVCMQDEPLCTPEHCEYACNFYTKVSEHKIIEKMRKKSSLAATDFRELAEKYEVCPFELSLEAALEAEVVVADYNYVFSPKAAFFRLFAEEDQSSKGANLVIDEAHNLPQRACDYYSPELNELAFKDLLERIDEIPPILHFRWKKLIKACRAGISIHKNEGFEKRALIKLNAEYFFEVDRQIKGFAQLYFEKIEALKTDDAVIRLNNYWSDFCFALAYSGDEFFATYRRDRFGDSVKITCCDGSRNLTQTLALFKSVVGFSATLKPFDYYAKLCGFAPEKLETREFSSPFPKENRKILLIPQVSTKYSEREANYAKIGQAISKIISVRPGNYFAFFPSYEFLEKTFAHIQLEGGVEVLSQQRNMSRSHAEEFMERLRRKEEKLLILAVQGGIFAEGIDFPGDELIGAFIIGPGLPNFDFEREKLREYYDTHYSKGFDYAYTYPAMAKVIQSAGRVIRSENDKGLIVLMDRRFKEGQYSSAMPSYWFEQDVNELISTKILDDLGKFWNNEPEV